MGRTNTAPADGGVEPPWLCHPTPGSARRAAPAGALALTTRYMTSR
ncbi:hypothetical protein [Vreelandella populi]|nr:hypothetical protein [Halomonas populi]